MLKYIKIKKFFFLLLPFFAQLSAMDDDTAKGAKNPAVAPSPYARGFIRADSDEWRKELLELAIMQNNPQLRKALEHNEQQLATKEKNQLKSES